MVIILSFLFSACGVRTLSSQNQAQDEKTIEHYLAAKTRQAKDLATEVWQSEKWGYLLSQTFEWEQIHLFQNEWPQKIQYLIDEDRIEVRRAAIHEAGPVGAIDLHFLEGLHKNVQDLLYWELQTTTTKKQTLQTELKQLENQKYFLLQFFVTWKDENYRSIILYVRGYFHQIVPDQSLLFPGAACGNL